MKDNILLGDDNNNNDIDDADDKKLEEFWTFIEKYDDKSDSSLDSVFSDSIYPAADDSISIRSDPSIIQQEQSTHRKDFIPWTKRYSFIEAHLIFTEEQELQNFKNRRGSKRFSSLRRQKSFTLEVTKDRPTFQRSQTTLTNNTIRSRSSQTSLLRRQHSESSTYSKKRRMSSSSSTLSKNSEHGGTLTRGDGPRALKIRDSKRNSKMAARFFFEGYQDKLREEMFSIEFPSTYDPTADPCRDEYIPLFKEYDNKLIGKTYQQLFYVRSRLSESARKSKFQCDGCFGCSSDYECTTPPQWV